MKYQDYKHAKERIKAAKAAYRKDNEKKEKPSYNMWQNAGYMLKYAGAHYPSLLFWMVISALITCLLSIANTYLPKTVLAAIEQDVSLQTLVAIIAIYTLVLLVLSALPQLLKQGTEMK